MGGVFCSVLCSDLAINSRFNLAAYDASTKQGHDGSGQEVGGARCIDMYSLSDRLYTAQVWMGRWGPGAEGDGIATLLLAVKIPRFRRTAAMTCRSLASRVCVVFPSMNRPVFPPSCALDIVAPHIGQNNRHARPSSPGLWPSLVDGLQALRD